MAPHRQQDLALGGEGGRVDLGGLFVQALRCAAAPGIAPQTFAPSSIQVFGANTRYANLWGRTLQPGMTARF